MTTTFAAGLTGEFRLCYNLRRPEVMYRMSMTMYRVLEARSSQALLSLLAINGKTIVPLREAEAGARFVSGDALSQRCGKRRKRKCNTFLERCVVRPIAAACRRGRRSGTPGCGCWMCLSEW